MSTYIHHHHHRTTTVSCETECQRPDWPVCPLAHVELPPGAEPFYFDPGPIRDEPSTDSSVTWGPFWLAVLTVSIIIAVVALMTPLP